MLIWFATFSSLFGSAIALFAAVLATRASVRTHDLATESAKAQDRRGRTEETMRTLRWAVELTVTGQSLSLRAGVIVLEALVGARIVIHEDAEFIFKVASRVAQSASNDARYGEDDHYEVSAPEGGAHA